MTSQTRAKLAVDIGGTFTDVVLQQADDRRHTAKLLTTYAHPGTAVLDGIREVLARAQCAPADVGLIIHGTTLATNALIERRGARTALLTTHGHRDSLAMAHEDRFEQYDINIDRPRPLVPRQLRLSIRERMDCHGDVRVPIELDDIDAALATLDAHGVESVAIGFLHAYANPAHERLAAERLRHARPGLSITLASEVCPEIREYERLSTACANAYVQPLMSRYLHRLQRELLEMSLDCPFLLMTSGGGLTTLETAVRFPVRLIESGPAGGAILAQRVAVERQASKMLSFDMGGTTAKLCLINDFQALSSRSFEVDRVYRFQKGSGLPVRIPVIEMVEMGAGGGSLATIDKLGRLQVGPESAGSEPGPACYGRGGPGPAVTDADVHLGRVIADTFASGAFALDAGAAQSALQGGVAQPLSIDLDVAAFGISEVVDENMAAAARTHAAEFGLDLGDRDMVAFGGAAPLHAARLADKLGIQRIVIPTEAGVGSAVGFLLAPVAYEVVRSRHQCLSDLDIEAVNKLIRGMQDEARAVVTLGAPGVRLTERRQAYMRYVGQGHEIAVGIPPGVYTPADRGALRTAFESAYAALYGRTIEGVEIEVLSWTLTLAAPSPAEEPAKTVPPSPSSPPCPKCHQSVYDPVVESRLDTPVYEREHLPQACRIPGPALITEAQTTTVVTSAFDATIDARGYIILQRRSAQHD